MEPEMALDKVFIASTQIHIVNSPEIQFSLLRDVPDTSRLMIRAWRKCRLGGRTTWRTMAVVEARNESHDPTNVGIATTKSMAMIYNSDLFPGHVRVIRMAFKSYRAGI
jgi:hypothetical protein